jgi:methylthioribose-1-phosphate isomerase
MNCQVSEFCSVHVRHLSSHLQHLQANMVAQAPSGKKPLPDMMTSIRIDQSGQVEIVDQLLLP